MNFSFGSNTPKTTAGLTLSTPANPGIATTGTGTTGLTFGSTPTGSTGLTFGSTPTGSTGLTFGSTPSATGFSLGGAGDSKSTTQTAAIKPIATATPLSTSFSLGATPAAAPASTTAAGFLAPTTSVAPLASTTGFSFGGSATPSLTTTSSGINFSLNLPTSSATNLKLGTTTTPTLGLGQPTASTATTATTLPTTTPAITAPQNAITFVQLEEIISKWTHELEEQEKIFMSQAAQISNWDNLLNSTSEKILAVNEEMQAMKASQHRLDNELDFILAQQRELEEVLAPLEKQASEMPSNNDPEREHTYHMAETLDTQLKQMSEDLKEIIEHLNESSRTQDNSDPIVQIGRILNAHMNSLQWIDTMTLSIQNQLENVTKLHDIHRRENERSFRISYE